MSIHYFDTLASTQQHCELLDLNQVEEFTCFCARTQTAGIGQRGNHWEAAPGQNLTFTLVLHPTFLPVAAQFCLTQALSLGITDWLHALLPQNLKISKSQNLLSNLSTLHSPLSTLSIKWPNDIYVGDRKICGILTSVRVQGGRIAHAISGIGLNVNQTVFPDWVPNPISLSLLTGKQYTLDTLLPSLIDSIRNRYEALREGADMEDDYLSLLYRRGIPSPFRYQGKNIIATILGVNDFGHLQLVTNGGEPLSCQLKEIQFL